MSAFYSALSMLVQQDSDVAAFFSEIATRRPLPLAHLTNLVFRAVQFLKLFRWGEPEYLGFRSENQWYGELNQLFADPRKRAALREIMLTRDTQTTKYQRYAGVWAVLAALLPHQKLCVADFGCGANLGLPGIAAARPFAPIRDGTPGGLVSWLLRQPVRLTDSLAIDRYDPTSVEVIQWQTACSYYPRELLAEAFTERNQAEPAPQSAAVRFKQLDLLARSATREIPRDHFHAVIMSTILYQHQPANRRRLLELGRQALRDGGILIIQDFVEVLGDRLEFIDRWFDGANYKTVVAGRVTGWRFAELLRWEDGRCRGVHPGKDFVLLQGYGMACQASPG